jgi:hypothetical protein
VHRSFVNGEFHTFDLLPFLSIEVQVKVTQREFREFPLQRGRFHSEIDQRANHHVAADSRDAVEKKRAHYLMVERS